jgi:DnaJ-class molecular chaperone
MANTRDGEKDSGRQGGTKLNPGDVAAPGTPGTGEAVCPDCQGSGKRAGQPCPNCGGTGIVIAGIAGG